MPRLLPQKVESEEVGRNEEENESNDRGARAKTPSSKTGLLTLKKRSPGGGVLEKRKIKNRLGETLHRGRGEEGWNWLGNESQHGAGRLLISPGNGIPGEKETLGANCA